MIAEEEEMEAAYLLFSQENPIFEEFESAFRQNIKTKLEVSNKFYEYRAARHVASWSVRATSTKRCSRKSKILLPGTKKLKMRLSKEKINLIP